MTEKIIFYTDSGTFGGHEMMTARFVETLHGGSPYTPVLLHAHPDFSDHLSPGVDARRLPFGSRTPLSFLRDLHPGEVTYVLQAFRSIDARVVVVAQGNVELGARGLIAARLAGKKLVSYLPVAYSFAEMGRAAGRLRDAAGRALYGLPEAFITVAEYQRDLLRRFTEAPVHRVPNPIDRSFEAATRAVPTSRPLQVAIIGRIYLPSKRQDVVVDAARRSGRADLAVTFHVVGDGPHRTRLERRIAARGLGERVRIHGWMSRDRLKRFLHEQIDAILIPSRFEGVPLVMLEAAAAGKPFLVASPELVDEYGLPERLRVDPDDPASVFRRLRSLAATAEGEAYRRARARLLTRHAPERFRRRLLHTFQRLTSSD